MRPSRSSRIALAIGAILIAGSLHIPGAFAAGGGPKCYVKVNEGPLTSGNGGVLARALKNAATNDRFHVGGTCVANLRVAAVGITIVADLTSGDTAATEAWTGTLSGGGRGRPVTIAAGGSATLVGVTVTGGVAGSSRSPADGGGILTSGSLTLSDGTRVVGNRATNRGGGIATAAGGSIGVVGTVTIEGNLAAQSGGGIYTIASGSLSLTDGVTIRDNTAGNGGGIFALQEVVLGHGVLVEGNRASGAGGGVYMSSATLHLQGALIRANRAAGSGGGGGVFSGEAIHASADTRIIGNVTLTASGFGGGLRARDLYLSGATELSGNTAAVIGGGAYALSLLSAGDQVQVHDNAAGWRGGGLAGAAEAMISLTDGVTISGNRAPTGGGVHIAGAARIGGGTRISGNVADSGPAGGGGILVDPDASLLLTDDAIVEENTAGTDAAQGYGGGIYGNGTVEITGNSIIRRNVAVGPTSKGGGVFAHAALRIGGAALITDNSAGIGGGVGADWRAVVLGSASISGNRAETGGGIWNGWVLEISGGGVAIAGNTASGGIGHGGGIFNASSGDESSMNGHLCSDDLSVVSGNTPDQTAGGGAYRDGASCPDPYAIFFAATATSTSSAGATDRRTASAPAGSNDRRPAIRLRPIAR